MEPMIFHRDMILPHRCPALRPTQTPEPTESISPLHLPPPLLLPSDSDLERTFGTFPPSEGKGKEWFTPLRGVGDMLRFSLIGCRSVCSRPLLETPVEVEEEEEVESHL